MQKAIKINKIIILVFIFGIIVNIFPTNAQFPIEILNDSIVYVGGNGPGNYTRIQDAIENANNGDTIFVYDDLSPYHENLYVYKKISIIGENKNTTIIDGGNKSSVVRISYDFGEPGFFGLSDFTIRNGDFGIYLSGTIAFDISDNILIDNKVSVIEMQDANQNFIENNIITDNDCGIYLRDSNNNTFSNNRIENNGKNESLINVIGLLDSHDNVISSNIMTHNHGIVVSVFSSRQEIKLNNIIKNNTILYNYEGISLSHFSSNSQISGNNISYNTDMGIYLWDNNNVTIDNNTLIKNNNFGIYIWADVYSLRMSNNRIIGNNIGNETGIVMHSSSHNTVFRNIIMNYGCGIYLSGVTYSEITDNTIQNNSYTYGMYLVSSQNNNIMNNNFVGNKKTNVFFAAPLFACSNHWDGNYWGRATLFPKFIIGKAGILNFSIPWFNIDWHPAKKPNN